jgi:N-acetyl-D-muramate 6-phosphate phosphatase
MTVEIERIKGICFDVDGTLSDTDDLWVSKLSAILRPLSVLLPERQMAPFARRVIMASESPANLVYHMLDRFDLDDDMVHLYHLASKLKTERRPASFWIIPGVRDMLQQLHDRYALAVVSARGSSTFHFLDQFGLLPFFGAVAIADTCRYTKPYPTRFCGRQQK